MRGERSAGRGLQYAILLTGSDNNSTIPGGSPCYSDREGGVQYLSPGVAVVDAGFSRLITPRRVDMNDSPSLHRAYANKSIAHSNRVNIPES